MIFFSKKIFYYATILVGMTACEAPDHSDKTKPSTSDGKIHFTGIYTGYVPMQAYPLQMYVLRPPILGGSTLCVDNLPFDGKHFDFTLDKSVLEGCMGIWNNPSYPFFLNIGTGGLVGLDPAALINYTTAAQSGQIIVNINWITTKLKNHMFFSCENPEDYLAAFAANNAIFPYTENGKFYNSFYDLTILSDTEANQIIGETSATDPTSDLGKALYAVCGYKPSSASTR